MWKNDYKTNVVAATNISHSLFDEKFKDADLDKDTIGACKRAIWYIHNTKFGKTQILKRSSKTFNVPKKEINRYIIETLGPDVFFKRNKAFDWKLQKNLNNNI